MDPRISFQGVDLNSVSVDNLLYSEHVPDWSTYNSIGQMKVYFYLMNRLLHIFNVTCNDCQMRPRISTTFGNSPIGPGPGDYNPRVTLGYDNILERAPRFDIVSKKRILDSVTEQVTNAFYNFVVVVLLRT